VRTWAVVMETLRLIHRLGLVPRRTIRAVLFTNEENGLRGGRDYAERHGDEHHVVAIEMDSGGFAPRGFGVSAGEGGVEMVESISRHLHPIGAGTVLPRGGGADIGPLRRQGVPVMGLVVEPDRYFDYHHTAADTLDKVDRRELDRNVAAMAWMTWSLAEHEDTLPRLEPAAGD
jgi:Zn-dependent M28 family amino/carboxypeptidase